jgi:stearoyl-CoA desaturase (Delta-9 desaturase)
MPDLTQPPVRKMIWTNIIFFTVTTLIGVVGAPLYLFHFGISSLEILLFVFFLIITPLCITTGYHRLFAHMSYKAKPIVQFFFLFFGAAAFEQSALKWASQHRTHHQFVDTDKDPYTIKKGFFYAHIGWLIFWQQHEDFSNVRDLERNPLVMHQHKHYSLWSIGAGIVLPLLIGALIGHFWGALIFAVCLRLTLVYHGTFCINSVCHLFGTATYDIYSSAKDHWVAAIITFGEGYHNYHHHFPADYRNGVRWYHWDPTKWLIAFLAWMGVASELKRISVYKIIAARLRAKHLRAEDHYNQIPDPHPRLEKIRQSLISNYEHLKQTLTVWEHNAAEYRDSVRKQISHSTQASHDALLKKMSESRLAFKRSLQEWDMLYAQILQFSHP